MDPKLAQIMAKRRQQLEDDEETNSQEGAAGSAHEHARGRVIGAEPAQAAREVVPEPAQRQRRSRVVKEAKDETEGANASSDVGLHAVQKAGVGITLTERHPFVVVSLRQGGPAAQCQIIREGDQLLSVDGREVAPHWTGAEVVAMVVGPANSEVELEFRRSQRHVFATRLVRTTATAKEKSKCSQTADSTIVADQGDYAVASSGAMNSTPRPIQIYKDDFDVQEDKAEQAIKHSYDQETAGNLYTYVTYL